MKPRIQTLRGKRWRSAELVTLPSLRGGLCRSSCIIPNICYATTMFGGSSPAALATRFTAIVQDYIADGPAERLERARRKLLGAIADRETGDAQAGRDGAAPGRAGGQPLGRQPGSGRPDRSRGRPDQPPPPGDAAERSGANGARQSAQARQRPRSPAWAPRPQRASRDRARRGDPRALIADRSPQPAARPACCIAT